jgi:1-acyl-sn-glycerol-3-phosphate acyltransferase
MLPAVMTPDPPLPASARETLRCASAVTRRGDEDIGYSRSMLPQATPPDSLPRRAARAMLRLIGWRTILVWPPEPRGVIMVYPHTSNWDFILGLLFRLEHALPASWVGKREMFPGPFLRWFGRIGGIPVDRRRAHGFVEQLLAEFRSREWMWLAITPEGTRSRTDYLKSGFYQLAVEGDLPVALGYIDYGARIVGIDTYLRMTGDRDADLARIREFYADKRARRPEHAGDLRFRR